MKGYGSVWLVACRAYDRPVEGLERMQDFTCVAVMTLTAPRPPEGSSATLMSSSVRGDRIRLDLVSSGALVLTQESGSASRSQAFQPVDAPPDQLVLVIASGDGDGLSLHVSGHTLVPDGQELLTMEATPGGARPPLGR